MRSIISAPLTLQRVMIAVLSIVIVLTIAACGSATPTRLPATATLSALEITPSGAPTVPPTATGPAGETTPIPPLPTVGTPGAPVTATVAATKAAVLPTRTPKPATTAAPPPLKPEVLSGRLIYDVFLGGVDFSANTINVANVSNGAAGQLIGRASWGAFSPDGSRIAYFHWADGLYIANADGGGAIGPLYVSPGVCCLNWSRDGGWIVFADSPIAKTPGGPIKMLKVDGAYKTIVNLKVSGNGPAFSPAGTQIVFSGCLPNTNTCGLVVTPTDGSGATRVLTRDNGGDAQWSPDGKRLLYQARDAAGNMQVYVINADGSDARKELTNGKSNDGQPAWSRGGGSIFWRSDQNGTAWAVFVMNADGSNKRVLVSNAPANPNLWGWQTISVAP